MPRAAGAARADSAGLRSGPLPRRAGQALPRVFPARPGSRVHGLRGGGLRAGGRLAVSVLRRAGTWLLAAPGPAAGRVAGRLAGLDLLDPGSVDADRRPDLPEAEAAGEQRQDVLAAQAGQF